jgi:hypothetical protein
VRTRPALQRRRLDGDGDGEQQGGRHEEAGQREHRQDDVGELGGDDGLGAPDQWLSQR